MLPLVALAQGLVTESVDFGGTCLPGGWGAETGALVSPIYSKAVTHVTLTYGAAMVGELGTLSVYAAGLKIADLNTRSEGASFDFPVDSDLHSFRVVTNGASLFSFSASWPDSRLAAPANVVATGNTGSSFYLSWDAVASATGYRVSIWTNVVTDASEGTTQWIEGFSNSGATTGSSAAFDGASHTDNGTHGWTCDRVYRSLLHGAIRVGSSSAAGWIATPPFESAYFGDSVALRICACATNSSESVRMSVAIVSGAVTNDLGVVDVAAGPDPSCRYVPIAGVGVGDVVVVHSPVSTKTSERPVLLLDEIAIVSGYSAGTQTPVVFREETVGADVTSVSIHDLPPCAVSVGVQALAASAQDNSESSATIVVDLANPPPVPVLSVSGDIVCSESGYVENFDVFDGLAPSSVWIDGVTLPYWQCRRGCAEVAMITIKSGMGNKNVGLYDFHGTNKHYTAGHSLAIVSKTNNRMYMGFAVTNNMDVTLSEFSLSYTARQWTFSHDRVAPQSLYLEYLVTNHVVSVSDDGAWIEVTPLKFNAEGSLAEAELKDKADYATGSAFAMLSAELGGVSIKAGEVLMLRWTSDPIANGEALGVSDVSLRCVAPANGMVMQFVQGRILGL